MQYALLHYSFYAIFLFSFFTSIFFFKFKPIIIGLVILFEIAFLLLYMEIASYYKDKVLKEMKKNNYLVICFLENIKNKPKELKFFYNWVLKINQDIQTEGATFPVFFNDASLFCLCYNRPYFYTIVGQNHYNEIIAELSHHLNLQQELKVLLSTTVEKKIIFKKKVL